MSANRWAVTLQCDYPGCQSVADAPSRDVPPMGWLAIDYHMQIGNMYGARLTDFCTLHADIPLRKLIEALMAEPVRSGPL